MATGGTLTVKPAEKPADGPDIKLRKYCEERAQALMATRRDLDPVIGKISSLTQPARGRFTPTAGGRPRKTIANRLYDGYGTQASEILTNGMTTGLSSPSRQWFKSKIGDPDLMKYHAVKQWLAVVDVVMYDFMAQTDFYQALKAGYEELGLFGTEAGFLSEHWKHGMVAHPLSFGEYWLALNDANRPDTLLRQAPMTVRQVVEKFVASRFDKRDLDWSRVSPSIKTAWDNSRYLQVVDILHLVEPNPAWDPVRFDAAGKPFRSIYWEAKSDHQTRYLEANGQSEQPFWGARWKLAGTSETYGVGPGWNALADLEGLQAQAKRLGDATDMAIKPPMVGPASVRLRLTPGSYTSAANIDKDSIYPAWQVNYNAITAVGKDLERCYRNIDAQFFVPLFMAISRMDGVQPRNNEEIFLRNEEKMTLLGPVIERVNGEKLGVAIDRVFGICSRRGLFPDPPEELHGQEHTVDFVSILAQAQRAVGLSVVERSLGVIGNMEKAFPGVADNIDGDAITVDYLERIGFPMIAIRDPAKRDAIRAGRAKAEAAAQARATMPAVKSAAEGAELLSRTDVRGQPLLDSLIGGVSG